MKPNSYVERPGDHWRQVNNTVPPSAGPWTKFGVGLLSAELFSGVSHNTPGYKKKKRILLPPHPHLWIEETQYRNRCNVSTTDQYKNGGKNLQTIYYTGPCDLVGLTASCDEVTYPCDDPSGAALTKLLSNVSLSQGSAAVSLAEVDRTASMVANTATAMAKAMIALRNGNLGGLASNLGISISGRKQRAYRENFRKIGRGPNSSIQSAQQLAASTWLNYSYGWKPLISDVYTQAQNLANYLTNKSAVIRVAKAKARSSREHSITTMSSGGGYKYVANASVTKTVAYTARFSIPDGANNVANVFGLNNPALVAWELVPYSFVVDWFLPIGSFLSSCTATAGLDLWELSKTTQRTCQVVKTWSGTGKPEVDDSTRTLTYHGRAIAHGYARKKERSIHDAWPLPSLPKFKDPRSLVHAASALALLSTAFDRR